MTSTRLPGKVLADIGGQPMLVRVVERAQMSVLVDEVVVATTTESADDPIVALCDLRGYACVRGSAQDVLDRIYQAARQHAAEAVVRVTGDCPLIDPGVMDHTIGTFLKSQVDFVANRLPPPWKRTFPIGLDTEVCSFQALERAWKEADQPHHREHVMPYLYEVPGRFRVAVVDAERDYGHLRWTVDTPEDLELVRKIYARFNGRDDFTWREVLQIFEREPRLAEINAQVPHKTYRDAESRA
jgi:spore coat polysaccharide biosynthesis protein SpsF